MNREVYPFKSISWNTRKLKEKWEPLQKDLIFATEFTAYEMVKRGHRKCDVYQLSSHNFDNEIDKVSMDKLHYKSILRSKSYQGFGHRHYRAEEIDENTFIYGCVCNTYEDMITFHDAGVPQIDGRIRRDNPYIIEINGEKLEMNPEGIDHIITGRLLGYPKCCSDWFIQVWLKDGCVDPMYETAINSPEHNIIREGEVEVYGEPMFNRLIRYFGFQIIPYFTHSYNCEESRKFTDIWFSIMKECAPEACENLLEILDMPMTWDLYNLIIYVKHPYFRGAVNGYDYPKRRIVHWKP